MSEPAWVPIGPAAIQDVGPEVAYAEFVAPVNITGTDEAGATPIVTAPSFLADGSSAYVVEFFSPSVMGYTQQAPGPGFALFLDGVTLGLWGSVVGNIAAGGESDMVRMPVRLTRRIVPAAGARTFSCRAWHSGSGHPWVYAGPGGAGQLTPGFIRVTKVPSAVPGQYGLVPPTAIGTTLPASPVDGQEFILTDSLTAGTYHWHLRYVAARASNKWVFVGGAPLLAEVISPTDTITSLSYIALATAGPSIAVPVAGDYRVNIGYSSLVGAGTTSADLFMSYDIGGTGAVDADAVDSGARAGTNGWNYVSSRPKKKSLPAATLTAKYKLNGAGTITVVNRWMELEPIAIGG